MGGSADIVSLIPRGGGGCRDDTFKSVIASLSDHWEGGTAPSTYTAMYIPQLV